MSTAVDRLVSNGNAIVNFLKDFSSNTPSDITIGWIEDDGSVIDKTFANIAKFQGIINSAFEKPNNDVVLFEKLTHASFKIPAGFKVKVGTTVIQTVSDFTVTVNAPVAGTDYKVFAKADGSFYADTTNQGTDKLIGGFHYGLVGTAEAPTGNKTEADMVAIRGINAYSFWDLKFRPLCSPEGMGYVNGKWYDIYLLNSDHIVNGTSRAGATIAGGVASYGRAIPKIPLMYGGDGTLNYGKLTWFQLCEIAKSHGKSLISYEEFPTIAYGVLEGTDCSALESVQGKVEHYDRLTSKFGIEQATGVQYVWGKDLMNGYGTTAFTWMDNADGRGQIYATASSPVAVALGGYRAGGVYAGSRSSLWSYYVWNSGWSIGCRFSCDHLKLV